MLNLNSLVSYDEDVLTSNEVLILQFYKNDRKYIDNFIKSITGVKPFLIDRYINYTMDGYPTVTIAREVTAKLIIPRIFKHYKIFHRKDNRFTIVYDSETSTQFKFATSNKYTSMVNEDCIRRLLCIKYNTILKAYREDNYIAGFISRNFFEMVSNYDTYRKGLYKLEYELRNIQCTHEVLSQVHSKYGYLPVKLDDHIERDGNKLLELYKQIAF